ncbi:MAG: hypothetical protein LBB88_01730, partial [Planctomycetaceae bacterium]|nr:hypothetical protein [Planctomycetaceae bacterium]
MKRIIVTIILIIVICFFVIGYFFVTDWRYRIDYSLRGDLILQMPLGSFAIPLVSPGEISFDDILTTGVKLISKDNKLFLLRDQSFPSRWYFDYRQPWTITNEEFDKHIELWEFSLLEGGKIRIEGYFWFEFYVRKITLTGTKQKNNIWSGEGLVSEGVMGLKPDE